MPCAVPVCSSRIRHPCTDKVMLEHGHPSAFQVSFEGGIRHLFKVEFFEALIGVGQRRPQKGSHAHAGVTRGGCWRAISLELCKRSDQHLCGRDIVYFVAYRNRVATGFKREDFGNRSRAVAGVVQ